MSSRPGPYNISYQASGSFARVTLSTNPLTMQLSTKYALVLQTLHAAVAANLPVFVFHPAER